MLKFFSKTTYGAIWQLHILTSCGESTAITLEYTYRNDLTYICHPPDTCSIFRRSMSMVTNLDNLHCQMSTAEIPFRRLINEAPKCSLNGWIFKKIQARRHNQEGILKLTDTPPCGSITTCNVSPNCIRLILLKNIYGTPV